MVSRWNPPCPSGSGIEHHRTSLTLHHPHACSPRLQAERGEKLLGEYFPKIRGTSILMPKNAANIHWICLRQNDTGHIWPSKWIKMMDPENNVNSPQGDRKFLSFQHISMRPGFGDLWHCGHLDVRDQGISGVFIHPYIWCISHCVCIYIYIGLSLVFFWRMTVGFSA